MAPLLAGLLRGFLPSGSFFKPGGNGWAHPVRIARCWFQFIILHLLFGQRFCIGQFAPCHQPAVCHRTPPVVIVVDDGKRLVIRRLRVSSYVHGPLGGIIAVNCQVTKGLGAPGLCPSAKPCPVSKVAAFKITYPCTVSKRSLLSVPRVNMTRSAGCYEIRGQTGEECNKIFPPQKHPQKSPECQAFGGGKS